MPKKNFRAGDELLFKGYFMFTAWPGKKYSSGLFYEFSTLSLQKKSFSKTFLFQICRRQKYCEKLERFEPCFWTPEW